MNPFVFPTAAGTTAFPNGFDAAAELVQVYLPALSILSVTMFAISITLIPYFICKIPENHFMTPHKNFFELWQSGNRVKSITRLIANVLGLICLFAGIIMLFVPGQGLLTILVGVGLLDFPKKRSFELSILKKHNVLKSINWIRQRRNRPPLRID